MLRVAVVVLPLLKLATSLTVDVDIDINTAAAAGTDPSNGAENPDTGPIGNYKPKRWCPREGDNCETDDDCPSQNNGCLNGGSMVCRANKCVQETANQCPDIGDDCETDKDCKGPFYPQCPMVCRANKCAKETAKQCPSEFDDCKTDDDCNPNRSCQPMKCGGIPFLKNRCIAPTPKKTTTEKPRCRVGSDCETDDDCIPDPSCSLPIWPESIKCSSAKKCVVKQANQCPRVGDDCETIDDCHIHHPHCLNEVNNPELHMVCRANKCEKPANQCPKVGDDCETDDDCEKRNRLCMSNIGESMVCRANKCEKPDIAIDPPECNGLFGQCETDSDCCQDARDVMKGRHLKCSVNKRCFYNFWPGGSDADDSCVPEGETCQADKKCCHCVESEDHVCFCKDGKCCNHNVCQPKLVVG